MASDYPFVIFRFFFVNKGHNSVSIIGNSTPHLSLFFSLILHVCGSSDKEKKKGRVKRSNFNNIEIQSEISPDFSNKRWS